MKISFPRVGEDFRSVGCVEVTKGRKEFMLWEKAQRFGNVDEKEDGPHVRE